MAIKLRPQKDKMISWAPRFLLMIEAALEGPKRVLEQGKHGIVFIGGVKEQGHWSMFVSFAGANNDELDEQFSH